MFFVFTCFFSSWVAFLYHPSWFFCGPSEDFCWEESPTQLCDAMKQFGGKKGLEIGGFRAMFRFQTVGTAVDGSEIRRSPVEVGSLSYYFQCFSTIPDGDRPISEPSTAVLRSVFFFVCVCVFPCSLQDSKKSPCRLKDELLLPHVRQLVEGEKKRTQGSRTVASMSMCGISTVSIYPSIRRSIYGSISFFLSFFFRLFVYFVYLPVYLSINLSYPFFCHPSIDIDIGIQRTLRDIQWS